MSDHARLQEVFQKTLGLPPTTDFSKLAYRQTKQWDSVAHMQLVAEIEAAFDIMLDTDEVIGLSSFPVAVEILRKRGVHVAP